jgi:selenide,water dikinase
MEEIKLTQFNPGAGCGCKISPIDLEEIIGKGKPVFNDPGLLVGYDTKDDAAVYDAGDGRAIISTTDFFTPIVDNPFTFGQIAATNAISDIYAMGGKPFMAVSILGWPLEKLSKEIAFHVIEGARKACADAECSLAGGHSINISDPVFGLAVTGLIQISNLKQNCTAEPGCHLYLTKPLGIGLVSTAQKKGIASEEHMAQAIQIMTTLNKTGMIYGKLDQVKAMTDVTGFGLLGHLIEMCEGSNVSAVLEFNKVPVIEGIGEYIIKNAIPGGTFRNWKSYKTKVNEMDEFCRTILCDPQTSGGLLVAVLPDGIEEFLNLSEKEHQTVFEIGVLEEKRIDSPFIFVRK